MHANTCSIDGRLRTNETVSGCLSPIHDEWLREARRFLLPATSADASFWDRWSAVRYLCDQYTERHGAESELVAELRPFVTAQNHHILIAGGERVAQLRLRLDRVGRRRVTTLAFAHAVADFLKALEFWCAEIEFAAAHVEADALPPEARRRLDHPAISPRISYPATA